MTKSNNTTKTQRSVDIPTRKIDFQVDTIPTSEGSAAYFSSWINTITENYIPGEDNSFNQSLSTLAHEQKHRDNHNTIDRRTIPMSLEQHYKICCYDEISAVTCELLQLRQEYLDAKTPEAKQKVIDDNPKFAYYFTAVKNGAINPESKLPAEFDKEMRFIAVETQKMWMNMHAEWYDQHAHTSMTKYFFARKDYAELTPNNANYNKVRQAYMTCGGIDFSKYIDDIPCINDNVKEADKLIKTNAPRDQINQKLTPQNFSLITNLPMSLEEYANLQAHQRYADRIKEILEGRKQYLSAKTDKERELITEQYNLYSYDLLVKKQKIEIGTPDKPSLGEIYQIANACCRGDYFSIEADMQGLQDFYQKHQKNLKSNPANYQAELKKIYKINGIDFYPYIKETTNGNLNITNASLKAIKNQPVAQSDFHEYKEKEIVIPVDFRTAGLSPSQQFELARKQMFVENMIATNPIMMEKNLTRISNYDEAIEYSVEDFAQQIRKDPETKKNWEKAERQLAEQIANLNKTTVIFDKASDKEFKKAMDSLNILPCKLDMSKYTSINIDKVLSQNPIPSNITEIENSSWYERLGNKTSRATDDIKKQVSSAWNTAKECTSSAWNSVTETVDNFQAWLSDTPKKKDESKAPYSYTSYQGEPQYPEWSENKRVSPVQYAEIYDFSSDILAQQQKELEEQRLKNMPENIKETMKLNRKIADEVYGKKAKKTTKKTTQKQTPTPPRRIEKVQVIAPQDNTNITRPRILPSAPAKRTR